MISLILSLATTIVVLIMAVCTYIAKTTLNKITGGNEAIDKFMYCRDVYSFDDIQAMAKDFVNKFRVDIQECAVPIKRYTGEHEQSIDGNKIAIMVDDSLDNDGLITDWFVEDVRMQAYNVNFESPMKYFESGKWRQKYIKYAGKSANAKSRYRAFRSAIREGVVRDTALFPLGVSLAVYKIFKPRAILDMCAGWGNRLISAIMYGPDYYLGVDPNTALAPKYKEIVGKMSPVFGRDPAAFSVVTKPFEDMTPADVAWSGGFDLMFSSPPYFSAEHYSDDPTQSSARYKGVDAWLNGFMYKSIEKFWSMLNIGGFVAMVLSDVRIGQQEIKYTDKVLTYIGQQQGAQYYGMLKYAVTDKKRGGRVNYVQPIWLFRKLPSIPREVYDPPLRIVPVGVKNKELRVFNIIREDMLIGGTKQRIAYDFIKTIPNKHIFYRGPVNGYAQVAIAAACKLLGKRFHSIVNKQYDSRKYVLTGISMVFGAMVHEVNKAESDAADAIQVKQIVSGYSDSYVLPLGMLSDGPIEAYRKSGLSKLVELNPKRIFMVASTGLIYRALLEMLPNCEFHVVFVGHKDYSMIDKSRTKVYEAPEKFRAPAEFMPPYPTEPSYDGKVWRFVLEHGIDGDYVMNVGGL